MDLGMSCSLSHVRYEMFNPVSMLDGPRANDGRRGHSCGAHLPPAPGPLADDLAEIWAIPFIFSRCKPRRIMGSASPRKKKFLPLAAARSRDHTDPLCNRCEGRGGAPLPGIAHPRHRSASGGNPPSGAQLKLLPKSRSCDAAPLGSRAGGRPGLAWGAKPGCVGC